MVRLNIVMESGGNCSALAFTRPPNIHQHLEDLGAFGWIVCCVGAVTTTTLIVLFIINIVAFVQHIPASRWRLLSWVTSMSMVMSFLAEMVVVIPRAAAICDSVKQMFIPFIMMHFIDLTLDLKGGQGIALEDLVVSNTSVTLCVPPCCCVGLCFKNVTYSRNKLRLIKAMVYQMPLVQLAVLILIVLLTEAEVIDRGSGPDGVFIFLSVLNILCFFMAMWAFNIITRSFAPQLEFLNFRFKANLVIAAIFLQKIQNFILTILTINEVIGCVPPTTSRVVMKRTIDASLTLIESFILGVLTFVDYRRLRPHHQRQQKQPEEELTTSAIEQQQQRQELAIDLNLK